MKGSVRCRTLLLLIAILCAGLGGALDQIRSTSLPNWAAKATELIKNNPLQSDSSSFRLGALDPNKLASLSNWPSKAAELIKNKLQSDSSSFQITPYGGFELNWDWNNKQGDTRKTSSTSSNLSSSEHIALNAALTGSLSCWLHASWVALMTPTPHPNPAIAATLPLRRDILTFSQAVVFPVPILLAAFAALKQNTDAILNRRLLLGIGTMSLWTGAGVFFGKTFSHGYDLFSTETRYAVGTIELAIGAWSLASWAQSVRFDSLIERLLRGSVGSIMSLLVCGSNRTLDNPDDTKPNDFALYTASTMGLLGLSILPLLASFPTATIPTILGRRLSRAASGFVFFAGVMAYSVRDAFMQGKSASKSIQTLRRGLSIGAMGHLLLVVGKFVGIDGGGLVIAGDGLWEFYPSMVNASRAATTLMLATFFITAFSCTR